MVGGIAVLAHWATIEKQISYDLLKQFLEEGRLDGVELRSAFQNDEQDTLERRMREVRERSAAAKRFGKNENDLKECADCNGGSVGCSNAAHVMAKTSLNGDA